MVCFASCCFTVFMGHVLGRYPQAFKNLKVVFETSSLTNSDFANWFCRSHFPFKFRSLRIPRLGVC